MRTIRRDATQPAQRRLRVWRDCRAPVPSVFPSAASPDGKTEVTFKPGSEESIRTGRLGTLAVPGRTCPPRAQARSPRAFETIGIHLNIALGLSNEVGPPYLRYWRIPARTASTSFTLARLKRSSTTSSDACRTSVRRPNCPFIRGKGTSLRESRPVPARDHVACC